jgi:hypothetical protein
MDNVLDQLQYLNFTASWPFGLPFYVPFVEFAINYKIVLQNNTPRRQFGSQ